MITVVGSPPPNPVLLLPLLLRGNASTRWFHISYTILRTLLEMQVSLFVPEVINTSDFRWLHSITNSTDMSLSKLWEIVRDSKDWHAGVHEVAKSQIGFRD